MISAISHEGLAAGWLAGCWLAGCWLLAAWLLAGWLAGCWLAVAVLAGWLLAADWLCWLRDETKSHILFDVLFDQKYTKSTPKVNQKYTKSHKEVDEIDAILKKIPKI